MQNTQSYCGGHFLKCMVNPAVSVIEKIKLIEEIIPPASAIPTDVHPSP